MKMEIIWKTPISVLSMPSTYKSLSGNACFSFLLAGKRLQPFSCNIPPFISFAGRWMTGIFLSSRVPVQSFFFFFYQFYLLGFGGSLASLSLCGLRALGAVAAGAIDGRMGIIIILFITYCLRHGLVRYGYWYNS